MLKIGEFSRLSRVSIRMLRHYDELNLLVPNETDPFTGYRYYTEDQLPLAGRIAALRDMGLGLAAIREILSAEDDPVALDELLQSHETELARSLSETERRLRLVRAARSQLRKDDIPMKYSVMLKTIPERTVASVRAILPAYHQEGMLWSTLMSETAQMRLIPGEPCYCYAIFYDSEHKERDVDVEIHKTVRGSYPDTEHVRFKTVPAVTVASVTFRGSYAQIGDVNAAIAGWVRDNGFSYNGPAFFIYHVSPHETQNPDEFITEICFPVLK